MEPPEKPDEIDCCNSGCKPCILDVYEEQLAKYEAALNNATPHSVSNKKNCMSLTTYSVFKLVEKISYNQESSFYTFEYVKPQKSKSEVSLKDLAVIYKPGQHFLLRGDFGCADDQFTKAYTPIPFGDYHPLRFTTLIKLYDGGLMSRYIRKLKINSQTVWRGPYGDFNINYNYKHILCIVQGTGIAPIYVVIKEILKNEDCECAVKLYFCVRNSNDIYLRDELYKLSSFWNFSYEVFLSNDEELCVKYNETIHIKRLSQNDISNYLQDKNTECVQILICGSEQFNDSVLQNVLNLSFDKSNVHVF